MSSSRSNPWWLIVLVVILFFGLGWFIARLPFLREEPTPIVPQPETIVPEDTAPPPVESATIVDVEGERPPPVAELTASEAERILRAYIVSTNYYDIPARCVRINNRGFRSAGFALEVWNGCGRGGASRRMGRWRVDARTRKVSRQR